MPDDVDSLLLYSLVVRRFSGNDVGYCRGYRTVDGERGGEEKAEKRCSENPFAGKQRGEPVGCGAMLSEQDVDPMEISDNDKYQQAVGRAVDYGRRYAVGGRYMGEDDSDEKPDEKRLKLTS